MNKKTNGSLERISRQKDIVQNHSKPFQAVLASFEALVAVEDPVRHEFELIRSARSHKIPIAVATRNHNRSDPKSSHF